MYHADSVYVLFDRLFPTEDSLPFSCNNGRWVSTCGAVEHNADNCTASAVWSFTCVPVQMDK